MIAKKNTERKTIHITWQMEWEMSHHGISRRRGSEIPCRASRVREYNHARLEVSSSLSCSFVVLQFVLLQKERKIWQELTSSLNRLTISPFLPIILPTSCKWREKKREGENVLAISTCGGEKNLLEQSRA